MRGSVVHYFTLTLVPESMTWLLTTTMESLVLNEDEHNNGSVLSLKRTRWRLLLVSSQFQTLSQAYSQYAKCKYSILCYHPIGRPRGYPPRTQKRAHTHTLLNGLNLSIRLRLMN